MRANESSTLEFMFQDRIGGRLPVGLRLWRGAIITLMVVLALAAAIAAKMIVTNLSPPATIQASGTIEATESDIAPKVQGRLIGLRVRDGDRVTKGEPVAILEQVDPGLDLDQARANVAAAAAQVGVARAAYDLQRDSYQTTLEQAREGVSIAHSRFGQAGENLGIETHTASLQVDQAEAQLRTATATYDKAGIDLSRARSLTSRFGVIVMLAGCGAGEIFFRTRM